MRRGWLVLSLLLVACAPWPRAIRPKVLIIGIDGVRVDILDQAETPHLDALIASGAFSAAARTRPRTVSGPGWSSMLIGVWMDKHGVENNDFSSNRYDRYPDFLSRIEQVRPELSTYAIVDWPPLGTSADGGPLLSDAIDELVNFDGETLGYVEADARTVAAASSYLRQQNPDAAFVYLGNVDVVGHDTSSLAPEYRAAIEAADAQVGELVAALRDRPTYDDEDWLLLLSTDHGRRDDGGHGEPSEQELTIFYLASGPSVDRQALPETPEIVDVAVTALTHLGIEIEPEWDLDGRVSGLRR